MTDSTELLRNVRWIPVPIPQTPSPESVMSLVSHFSRVVALAVTVASPAVAQAHVEVQGSSSEGWVKKTLVSKR